MQRSPRHQVLPAQGTREALAAGEAIERARLLGSDGIPLPLPPDVDAVVELDAIPEHGRRLIGHAYRFAALRHDGQLRKGTSVPYLVHPASVARILVDDGARPELVAAGLLHDVLEDTPTAPREIGDEFGNEVRRLVEAVTRRPPHRWVLPNDPEAAALKGADLANNIADTVLALDRGADVWSRFASRTGKLSRWSRSLDMVAAVIGERHPLVEADRLLLAYLETQVPARHDLAGWLPWRRGPRRSARP